MERKEAAAKEPEAAKVDEIVEEDDEFEEFEDKDDANDTATPASQNPPNQV